MLTSKNADSFSPFLFAVLLGAALAAAAPTTNAQSGFFEASIAYPLTESNVTFSQRYRGEIHSGVSYTHALQRHFRLGASMEYSRFRDPGIYDVNMNVFMPSVLAVYGTHFSGRHRFEATLRAGNAWIVYRSEEPDFGNHDESGPYISPGIRFVFQATPGLKAQTGLGYKIIFEHFRDDNVKEDGTIRYLVFGTGILLGI